MHNFWVVDYMFTYSWSGKKSQSKQAGEGKKQPYLIYIALTIEFGQQYFLNVPYSELDMQLLSIHSLDINAFIVFKTPCNMFAALSKQG